jgi:hypothetical protein
VRPHLSSNNFLFIHQSCLAITSRGIDSEAGETWLEMTVNLSYELSLSIPLGSLTFNKIVRRVIYGFISLQNEVVLLIFIAVKNPLWS